MLPSGDTLGDAPSASGRARPSSVTIQIVCAGGSGSDAGFGISPARFGPPPRTNTRRPPSGVNESWDRSCPSSAVQSVSLRPTKSGP